MSNKLSPGARFRKALKENQPLQIVGTINAYAAMMADKVGHQAIYLSGGGVANASYGLPDLGMTTMNDVVEDVRRITAATDVPLLVDIDTGWGGAFNIARTIREMERAGAAAVHIEDQVAQKRCGHRPNKEIVSQEEMVDRIKAAVDAREDEDFFIMARTDAFQKEGLEAAIERAKACIEAGADGIFAEAVTELEHYKAFSEALDVPILANITEFGATPLYNRKELAEAGADMVLYPLSAFRAMNKAALTVYQNILEKGDQKDVVDLMQTRMELYALHPSGARLWVSAQARSSGQPAGHGGSGVFWCRHPAPDGSAVCRAAAGKRFLRTGLFQPDRQCRSRGRSGRRHFLELLHGKKPSELHERVMNVSLILYAEHEFNASTFTARVCASTLSDIHSCVTGAIGSLRGPLHGGANEAAMALIQKFKTPEEAEEGLMGMLERKEKIMGFGHAIYKESDPRNAIIKQWSKKLAEEVGDTVLYPVSERCEAVMWREKKLFCNADFFHASAYHFMGIPTELFTPIFVMSRVSVSTSGSQRRTSCSARILEVYGSFSYAPAWMSSTAWRVSK